MVDTVYRHVITRINLPTICLHHRQTFPKKDVGSPKKSVLSTTKTKLGRKSGEYCVWTDQIRKKKRGISCMDRPNSEEKAGEIEKRGRNKDQIWAK